jgi:flagellin
MSSILTNSSAMVALQTLNMTNKHLTNVQGQISTGKKVATARDNASIWAIAQTMNSDVGGFKGISDSLATGSAAVAVARTAAETVTDLLGQVKAKIVAAQDPASDKAKLQTDINELVSQVGSVVDAAQFNGLNLVNGSNASVDVLASLNRDGSGNVTSSSITVNGQDLSSGAGTIGTGIFSATGVSSNGTNFGFGLDAGSTDTITIDASNLAAGDKLRVSVGGKTATYTVTANDLDTTNGNVPEETIAVRMRDAVNNLGISGLTVTEDGGDIIVVNGGTVDLTVAGDAVAAGAGGLSGLSSIDVTTGATQALADIEGLVQTAIDASAAFGSSQARIDIQSDFVGKLTDTLNTGIGALVDANMEEAAARLQALQVQQQLGIQALSIANQSPQNVLALFR